jgi:CRISPR-associated protein Csm2
MEIKFYKDREKKIINKELFSSQIEEIAKEINKERDLKKTKLNHTTQVRKFFDEVIRLKKKLGDNPTSEDFEKLHPYINMINAKAAYASGRDLISKSFKEFISDSLKQIESKEDFDIFVNLFESFIGFYKFYYEKEKPKREYNNYNQGGRR